MNKPPKVGTRNSDGVIISMTEQEQAEWLAWRDLLDPSNPDDLRYLKLIEIGNQIYDCIRSMVEKTRIKK